MPYFDPPPVGTVGAGIAGSFGKYLGDGLSIGPSTFNEAGSVVTASGDFRFSGTGSPGLRLKSLTTTQRDATTGGAGDLIYNSTTDRVNLYRAAGWGNGWVRLEGDSMTGPLVIAGGTITANAPLLDLSQTWNNAAVTFFGATINCVDTASSASSRPFRVQVSGVTVFDVFKSGTLNTAGNLVAQGGTLALGSASDVVLIREGANSLALRNSTNIQTFAIQQTYTDGGNYRRNRLTSDGSGASSYFSEGLGTGLTGNSHKFYADGTLCLTITTGGATFAQNLSLAPTVAVAWASKSRIQSSVDGLLTLANAANNGFTRLCLGGVTSAEPALAKSGASLQAKLADNSAFTFIQGKLQTDNAYAAGAVVGTGSVVIYDSTGTAYRVPCLV